MPSRDYEGTTTAPLDDEVAATEGAVCTVAVGLLSVIADWGTAGGVCLAILMIPTGGIAIFAVANALPVFGANFLGVLCCTLRMSNGPDRKAPWVSLEAMG